MGSMTTARRNLISLEDTPYYHCYVRCVRQAFLFGDDKYTRVNYDHRREWIREKILSQTDVFAILIYIFVDHATCRQGIQI